jgi:hypothetical protein
MAPAVTEHYPRVRLSISTERPYGRRVTTPDAASIAELIDDCAQLPTTFRDSIQPAALPATATSWQVSEGNLAQVSGLDEYV